MSRKRAELVDLTPYTGCDADASVGMTPLAVGWLRGGMAFETGAAPASFLAKLLPFCQPGHTVCLTPAARSCPLCRQLIPPYGQAEIRVIGELDIYAAPDLIYHYVSAHDYLPPPEFVEAVLNGPGPHTAEHRALRRALQ